MWDWMGGQLVWVTSPKPKGSVLKVSIQEDLDEGRPDQVMVTARKLYHFDAKGKMLILNLC